MKIYNTIMTAAALAASTSLSIAQGLVLFGEGHDPAAGSSTAVSPISAPYFNEDAYVNTGVRAWYANHHFYSDTIGGEVNVYAVQVRAALTRSIQFVAYKDGYTQFDDTAAGDSGWNDIGAGLKWAFHQDWENRSHAAVGIGYELGLGEEEALQDTDELRLWASYNKGIGEFNLGINANYIIAQDHDEGLLGNSDLVTVHFQADYHMTDWFSPVVGLNGYFVTDEGAGLTPFSGVDAGSLPGGADEDTITGVVGFELRPFEGNIGVRAAYETELTNNVSLFGHRWTFGATYDF